MNINEIQWVDKKFLSLLSILLHLKKSTTRQSVFFCVNFCHRFTSMNILAPSRKKICRTKRKYFIFSILIFFSSSSYDRPVLCCFLLLLYLAMINFFSAPHINTLIQRYTKIAYTRLLLLYKSKFFLDYFFLILWFLSFLLCIDVVVVVVDVAQNGNLIIIL